jgi:para-aminobenzoate synthetase
MSETLLIDNYDSFTYNLYALIAQVSGRPPLTYRNDEVAWSEVLERNISRIVISPGPGRPQRPADLGLSADAISSARYPILGVCLGHQAIAHLHGARVDLAREPIHGRRYRVWHGRNDLFEGIPSPFHAVRYHSLAVTDLPAHLQALAWTDDGTLMALRHRELPLWGVQFHPESVRTEYGAALLQRFFDLTSARESVAVAADIEAPPPGETSAKRLRVYAFPTQSSLSPAHVFSVLYGNSDTAFWLDSANAPAEAAYFSYMGDLSGPRAEFIRYHAADSLLQVTRRDGELTLHQDVFDYLRVETDARRASAGDVPFGFTGGYVGYFGYELKAALGGAHAAQADTPDSCWIYADRLVAFDHRSGATWLLCLDDCAGLSVENRTWVDERQRTLEAIAPYREEDATRFSQSEVELEWRHSPERYREKIMTAVRAISEGETYEVCLTNQLFGHSADAPLQVYRRLRRINPAPFAAFLKFGSLCVLCSSPELFLRISADGIVESKPIKGTAPRGLDSVEDDRLARELSESVKNISENLMIVDLLRNDMNRVCEPGSVHVTDLFVVERYATVHQLVSTIRGRLRSNCHNIDCIRAAFPGGSMTGAPKVRTMSILDSLEAGPRGVYSGSIGYLSSNDSAQLNIVIRTIVMNAGRVTIGTGGAIVALSDADEEYAEMQLKVAPLLRALGYCEQTSSASRPPAEACEAHASR